MEKTVAEMSFVEILDKNVDQVQLAKDLAEKYALAWIKEKRAKIESGEIDLVKGTELDKVAALAAIDALLKLAA